MIPLSALAERSQPVSPDIPDAGIRLIVEGAYPYVIGGVSGWLQDLITHLPDVRFVIAAIKSGTGVLPFQLTPPSNVVAVVEIGFAPAPAVSWATPHQIAVRSPMRWSRSSRPVAQATLSRGTRPRATSHGCRPRRKARYSS